MTPLAGAVVGPDGPFPLFGQAPTTYEAKPLYQLVYCSSRLSVTKATCEVPSDRLWKPSPTFWTRPPEMPGNGKPPLPQYAPVQSFPCVALIAGGFDALSKCFDATRRAVDAMAM